MQNNSKFVKAKIYGMLLESNRNLFLSVQYAYSLEEAFYLAKLEFNSQDKNKIGTLNGAKISLFSVKTLDTLFGDLIKIDNIDTQSNTEKDTVPNPLDGGMPSLEDLVDIFEKSLDGESPIVKENKPADKVLKMLLGDPDIIPKTKNEIMKEIIEKKDIEMFNRNKGMFTAAERKYIRERLK